MHDPSEGREAERLKHGPQSICKKTQNETLSSSHSDEGLWNWDLEGAYSIRNINQARDPSIQVVLFVSVLFQYFPFRKVPSPL